MSCGDSRRWPGAQTRAVSWSPIPRARANQTPCLRFSLDTGEKRQLTDPQHPVAGDTDPAVSPDGSWLVFRRNAWLPFIGDLYRLPLGRGLVATG